MLPTLYDFYRDVGGWLWKLTCSTGVQMMIHGMARAQWDEQRAYTKGSAGKLSHRNAEVYLDETVIISSRSKRTRVCFSFNLAIMYL
jgi:hypothetical protein